jgi:CelD/BcsL family acetyltransferase involved in cellulose biosynthesis
VESPLTSRLDTDRPRSEPSARERVSDPSTVYRASGAVAPPLPEPTLRSITVDQPAEARGVWSQWDELAVQASRPYCSPAWMMAWWEHVAPPRAQLRITAVFDDEGLVGIAPFFLDRGPGGVRRCRLLGAGTCAPLDILARKGMEQAVGAVIARSLAEACPAADVIMLEGVPGDSSWPALLCDLWPKRGSLTLRRQFAQPVPFVELRGRTYDDWLRAKTSPSRRKLRKEAKALEEQGGTVRLSRNAEELARDLEAFSDLHRARWRSRGGSAVLDARVERMLAQAGAQLVEKDRFRLWSMDLDGRTISSHLFVVAGGEASYWLGGFDEREARVRRPGILMVRAALEHAFIVADQRLDLGPGGQPYKYEFTQTANSAEWILLVPRGPRSLLARAQLARLRTRMVTTQRLSLGAKRLFRRALAWRQWRPGRSGR